MSGHKATLKPAADKLPLAVRKNVRDEWEAKKPELEKRLSDLLGEPWTITANASFIYSNVKDESYSSRVGQFTSLYIEAFLNNAKRFVEKFGDDGKAELNSTASQHIVNFGPQDSTNFKYGGLVVENGVLRLVFSAPSCFATNVDDVSKEIAEAMKTANAVSNGGTAYNIVARNGVTEDYESKIDEVKEKFESLVGVKDIKLMPNFEENAEALSKSKNKELRTDWDVSLGRATLSYFDAFARRLGQAGFKEDDMLQEGFQEAVFKNEIAFCVVDKLEKGNYNEVVVEDGMCRLQTTAAGWWTNVDDIGKNILDLL